MKLRDFAVVVMRWVLATIAGVSIGLVVYDGSRFEVMQWILSIIIGVLVGLMIYEGLVND